MIGARLDMLGKPAPAIEGEDIDGKPFRMADLKGNAERVAAEAVEHSLAAPVQAGLKDLVLKPSHLALTIHEIIAHPTELDRIVSNCRSTDSGSDVVGRSRTLAPFLENVDHVADRLSDTLTLRYFSHVDDVPRATVAV